MPAGRTAKNEEAKVYPPPPDAEAAEIRRYYRRSSLAWILDICHVEDRGSAGLVLPFKDAIRQPQRYKINEWRKLRAFNAWRNLNQLGLTSQGCRVLGKNYKAAETAIPAILKHTVTGFLEDVGDLVEKSSGKRPRLHDGPVKMWEGKGRQVGFSFIQQQIQLWRASTRGPAHFIVIAHDDDTTKVIFGFSKITYDYWPENLRWMRPVATSDARNRYEFDNGSTITVRTAAGTRIIGRKIDGIHSSEISHYENPDAFVHALSAIPMHCHLHIESTANGPRGFYYEVSKEALTVDTMISLYDAKKPIPTMWAEVFTPWLDDPEYKLPVEEWEVPFFEDSLSEYEQHLMRTDPRFDLERLKFRRYKMEHDTKRHPVLSAEQFWMQEFPASKQEMFQTSGSAVFNPDRLREFEDLAARNPPIAFFKMDGKTPPIRVKEEHQANFALWEKPIPGASYVIGVDVAMNLAHRDRSWVTVFRRLDEHHLQQAAEWLGYVGPKYLGDIVTFLAIWYNNAFIVPEENSAGRGTIDTITLDNGYSSVYIHRPIGLISRYADGSVRYGFVTSLQSKWKAIRDFASAVDLRTITILSKELIKEMWTFHHKEDGAPEAESGQHDDGVISAALANYGVGPGRGAPVIDDSTRFQLRGGSGATSSLGPGGGAALDGQVLELGRLPEDPRNGSSAGLTAEERATWRAIDEDLRLCSIKNGFDPDTGTEIDEDQQLRLLRGMEDEWAQRFGHLPGGQMLPYQQPFLPPWRR